MSNFSKMTVRICLALTVFASVCFLSTDVKAEEYEGAFPGHYTNLQRPPEETFREGKLLMERDEEGHAIFEIPKGTFGAAKFVLHNSSSQWTVGTVWLYMLPQKVFIGTRKVNIEPGKKVVVVIPTKFAINEAGVRFAYDVKYGFGKKWSGKFTLRMAKDKEGRKPPGKKDTKDTSGSRKPKQGDTVINSVGMKLVYIPPGQFTMGCPMSAEFGRDETPQHRVRISRGFYMGMHELTQAQYRAVTGSNDSQFRGDDLPVEQVSWQDAVRFCERLSQKEGRRYRLPTEAEWEYAARGGPSSRGYRYSGSDNPDKVAWHKKNSESATHSVGRKTHNELGLYDMSGNVSEYCSDWYEMDYYRRSPSVDPQGPATGDIRAVRGGSWRSFSGHCRSTFRSGIEPKRRSKSIGFRVVLELEK